MLIDAPKSIDRTYHRVTYKPTRPNFTITELGGTSTKRGYHETDYEVVSQRELSNDAFRSLDALGLLGFGQAYSVRSHEVITDEVPAVTIDTRTGAVLPDVVPVNHFGEVITSTHPYTYHRYVVCRVCDSGD